MKAINTLLSSLLLTTACGSVVDSTDPGTTETGDAGIDSVDGIDADDAPPPPELPFLVDDIVAATTANALFPVTFARGSEIRDIVGETAPLARFDIVEQRIVTKVDGAIEVTLTLDQPTGVFARTIATDAVKNQPTLVGPTTTCATNGIFRFDLPECSTTPPAKSATPATGPITRGRWRIEVVSEATGAPIAGCLPTALSTTCVLPNGPAGAAYKVRVAADGFADLWNDSANVGELLLDGKRFTGTQGALEFQCEPSLYEAEGNYEYCYAHWVFNRYTAIDAAALAFNPLRITIAASGATKSSTSNALTWDAGNDNLPGVSY